jgi:hypothetical protein
MKYKFNDDFYYDLHKDLQDYKSGKKDGMGAVVTEEDIVDTIDWALKEEMDRIFNRLWK